MQAAEIELKFPVSDPQALQSRLPQLGFRLDTPRTFERNILYDTPSRELRAKRQILRLRKYGDLWTLTHKRLPDQPDDLTRYKVRIETETTVTDGPALSAIFEQLGYIPAFTYEKYRTEWSHTDPITNTTVHLVIDETPIGNYAELENSSSTGKSAPAAPPKTSPSPRSSPPSSSPAKASAAPADTASVPGGLLWHPYPAAPALSFSREASSFALAQPSPATSIEQ